MSTYRVSVVMPVRNGARFLPEAMRSILDQTLRELEVVVVDDASDDATPDILAQLAREDGRIRVLRGEGEGLARALNAGWRAASAPLIARMDADDMALPDRLERQVAYLDAKPEVALLGGAYEMIDERGQSLGVIRYPDDPASELLRRNCFAHPTVVMRRSVLEELGGYRFDQVEDYDLWLRIAERHRVANLRAPVLRYRYHGGQFSVDALERQAAGRLAVRKAANARREARDDPLNGVDRLDRAVAERLGVTAAEIGAAASGDALWWAGMLAELGDGETARKLVVRSMPGGGTARGRRALLLLNRAKAAFRRGRRPRAALLLVAAALTAPSVIARGLARRR